MSSLALSDSFEYLCYGSADMRNICTLTVYRRQIMTTNVDPRTVRFKGFKINISIGGQHFVVVVVLTIYNSFVLPSCLHSCLEGKVIRICDACRYIISQNQECVELAAV